MTDDPESAIPVDAHPDPVLRYAVEDGTPVVTATNPAFEAAFESVPAGSPVSALFDRFEVVETAGSADARTHLVRGDATVLRLGGAGDADLARTVPADDAGFLVFVPRDDVRAVSDAAGVGQVASAISHDLRNPLDVAEAHLRAARETGAPEHFDAVAGAHDRMERIIRDVLTLARGPGSVDASERVSIGSAVEDAWGTVDTDRATLEAADALPAVTADGDRVRRLFENLFRNAVEHAGEAVTVRVGALDDGFYVADDGPGVPPAERAAVFDPGHSAGGGGTGLGLAIVDRIVAAHGWDLCLTAARDGGARFEVRW